MSQTDYALHRGVSQPRISALISKGKLAGCIKTISGRKKIDRDKADTALDENLDQIYNRPKPPKKIHLKKQLPTEDEKEKIIIAAGLNSSQTLAESQRRIALYKSAREKIELEEKQGDLLQKTDVEKNSFEMARMVRDSILNIPDRISAELASMTTTHSINDKLTTELTQALENMSS